MNQYFSHRKGKEEEYFFPDLDINKVDEMSMNQYIKGWFKSTTKAWFNQN